MDDYAGKAKKRLQEKRLRAAAPEKPSLEELINALDTAHDEGPQPGRFHADLIDALTLISERLDDTEARVHNARVRMTLSEMREKEKRGPGVSMMPVSEAAKLVRGLLLAHAGGGCGCIACSLAKQFLQGAP